MLRENYDLSTIISAVITLIVIVLIIRFVLYLANRKGTTIQKPDWVESDKFDTKKSKKK